MDSLLPSNGFLKIIINFMHLFGVGLVLCELNKLNFFKYPNPLLIILYCTSFNTHVRTFQAYSTVGKVESLSQKLEMCLSKKYRLESVVIFAKPKSINF